MKKSLFLTLLSLTCAFTCACNAIPTTTPSKAGTADTIEETIVESSKEAVVSNSENDNNIEQEECYDPNPDVRFYLSAHEPGQFTTVTVQFLVNDQQIASFEDMDLSYEAGGLCLTVEKELLGNAESFDVLITAKDTELLRTYGCISDHIFGVSLYYNNDTKELESGLAGGVIEHIGAFYDRQGTSDIYSSLIVTQSVPKSCLVSEITYEATIDLYRLTSLKGSVVFGDELNIGHFIPYENEVQVYGDIMFGEYDECATFTVTKSEFDEIAPGNTFEFPEY